MAKKQRAGRGAPVRPMPKRRRPRRGAVSRLNRLAGFAATALVAASVVQELRKPADRRTWEGRILGVPYDYRRPTVERLRSAWWAPEDPRVVMPRAFGLGWDLNVGRLVRLAERHRLG